MKLYYSPGACSLAPHIALLEAGLKFDAEKVDLASKKTAGGADYKNINPKGYVPALTLDDGTLLTECSAIIQYIADQAPAKGLMAAAGSRDRAKQQEWIGFVASELHKGFSPLWNGQMPDAAKKIFTERLEHWFDMLNNHFAGHNYLMGDNFSVADGYAFTILNWTNFLKMPLDRWPNVQAFMVRVAARPGAQAALKAEGLA
jgi:glutathione S-transferase